MTQDALVIICGLLALMYLGIYSLHYFQDVPDLYLQEQSIREPTRLTNESPIYHSNKSSNLRVGLDIRYDSYKLRSGNLNDIWEIAIQFAKKTDRGINIDNNLITIGYINYCIENLQLGSHKVISIPKDYKIDSKWLVVLFVGFVKQLTVEFYIDKPIADDAIDISKICLPSPPQGSYKFINNYTPEKDKGIAIRLHNQISQGIKSIVDFTQLNIVSGVASTIKHLPNSDTYRNSKMVIVSSNSTNEDITNLIVKFLTGLILNCNITICDKFSEVDSNAAIISVPELKLPFVSNKSDTITERLQRYLLTKSVFPFRVTKKLIYINTSINKKSSLSLYDLNTIRIQHQARVVKELCYYNIVGPIILTDYYDYRQFNIKVNKAGCIAQSLEIKLINLQDEWGNLLVRGYTIGKTLNVVNDQQEKLQPKDNDGFMPISIVKGKWGNDGCLYVL